MSSDVVNVFPVVEDELPDSVVIPCGVPSFASPDTDVGSPAVSPNGAL